MTGIILNGGKSSRSGVSNKAFLKLGGITVLERLYETMCCVFDNIIIISKDEIEISKLIPGVKVFQDAIESMGPLSGIYTGLVKASQDKVFVCACDMPFIQASHIRHLIDKSEGCDIVCFRKKGYIEPLCAVYDKSCISPVKQILNGSCQPSVMSLIRSVHTRFVDIEDIEANSDYDFFMNINTPEDYEKALEFFEF